MAISKWLRKCFLLLIAIADHLNERDPLFSKDYHTSSKVEDVWYIFYTSLGQFSLGQSTIGQVKLVQINGTLLN